ncbi:hypothetical protein Ccar_09705 [Clostridium carboxidivorans P7]|uniref:Uncharacterized protein n=1 Tax=Clostridium carboxidivorans P7 TaxID=536227 RepID=C6PPW8_9CLOT|nr:hypothetical protein Ccar_09705 [Clostridium carboxidivorans P7]EET88709.1 hypothetical protein CcarbDRAFT_0835 [Clostridium carboxidivorans P7]
MIYYNTCISLSWQVLWLYLDYNLEGKLPENKLYYKSIKKCNFNELLYRLTLAKEIKLRDYYVKGFLENPLVKYIRQKYNYLKHRGTYYFSFLGLNDSSSMMFSIDNKTIPMISRISVDTEKWKKQLIDFDKLFQEYFSEIVRTVVPKDFDNTTFGLKEPVAYYNKHKEEIDKM